VKSGGQTAAGGGSMSGGKEIESGSGGQNLPEAS